MRVAEVDVAVREGEAGDAGDERVPGEVGDEGSGGEQLEDVEEGCLCGRDAVEGEGACGGCSAEEEWGVVACRGKVDVEYGEGGREFVLQCSDELSVLKS